MDLFCLFVVLFCYCHNVWSLAMYFNLGLAMAGTVVIDPRVAALMAKFEEEEGEVKQEQQQLPKANLPKNLEEFLAAEKLVR